MITQHPYIPHVKVIFSVTQWEKSLHDYDLCLVNKRRYLKMKIKSISNMQKVATLSMVFIRTTSCLLRAGRNRTSFRTLSRRKVRRTDKPPSASPAISHTLVTSRRATQNYTRIQFQGVKELTRI